MSRFLYILFFSVLWQIQAVAQNLVLNPSFEDTIQCPSSLPIDSSAEFWSRPVDHKGTSDHFHPCNTSSNGAPNNLGGVQSPFSGQAYGGVIAYTTNPSVPGYTEYLTGRLSDSLTVGQCYKFSYSISLGEASSYSIPDFSIYFSQFKPISNNLGGPFPNTTNLTYTPQIETRQWITDQQNWIRVERFYLAQGGETYFTMGNFKDYQNVDTIKIAHRPRPDGGLWTYFYIDSVALEAVPLEVLPQVNLGNDTILCIGQSISFDSLLPNNPVYVWNNLSNESKFTIDSTGNYWVEAYNGCSYVTDTIHVEFVQPMIDLGNDRLLCKREEIILKNQNESTDHPNATFLWNTGETTDQIAPLDSGVYWLQASIQHCIDKDSIHVYYHLPQSSQLFSHEIDTTLCISGALKAQSTIWNDTYNWNTGATTQSISVDQSGTYEVYTENECTEATSLFNVHVETAEEGLHDYNVFSPNGDFTNELFTIYEGNSEEYALHIYNRWGRMIWTTSDPKEHWDGGEVSDGVYFYELSFKNCLGETVNKKGTVEVKR